MHWYLIHTKPRQEKCALENLERQGYSCYLPVRPVEQLRQGVLRISDDPLFPRYLFIQLGHGESAKSWGPIRSTKGVGRMVCFGAEPAKVDSDLIQQLRVLEAQAKSAPQKLFVPGEKVRMTEGAWAGVEGVYQITDGEQRALVLIEILSKPVIARVSPIGLRKVA